MSGKPLRLLAVMALAMSATIGFAASIASAGEKGDDAAKAAADDPRSGAAINLQSARNPHPEPLPRSGYAPSAIELLPTNSVNNRAADTGATDTQSETTVIDLGGGRLVAAFNDSGSFGLGNGRHFTGYAYSSNRGRTWTDPGILPDSTEGDGGDPVLAHNSGTGRVFLATLGFFTGENIQVFRSDDGGHTFLAPVNATPGYGGSGDFQDKNWLTVDNFPGGGNGNAYLCWTRFYAGGAEIRFTRSTDQGATFGPNLGTLVSTGGQGCFVTVGPDHAVYVFYYRGTGPSGQGGDNRIYMRRSADNGATFQPEVMVADLFTTTTNGNLDLNGGVRSNSFPHAAVNSDPKKPTLVAIYNDDPNLADPNDNGDIFMVTSINGGASWSPPKRVNDDTAGDQFFPTVAFDENGNLMIGYYSRSYDSIDNLAFHRRGRLGMLKGKKGKKFKLYQSFQMAPNTPVAIGQDPAINPTYMGDYDQIAGEGSWFSSTFSANRDGDAFFKNQPDVFFGRIRSAPRLADLSVKITKAPKKLELGKKTKLKVEVRSTGGKAEDAFVALPRVPGLIYKAANGTNCTVINSFVDCNLGKVKPGKTSKLKVIAFAYQARKVKALALGTTSSDDHSAGNNTGKAKFKVVAGGATTQTFSSGNIAVPINDLSTSEISIVVPPGGDVVSASVGLRLNHTFDADLDISLVAPNGQQINLSSDNGGSGDNYGTGANDCSGAPTVLDDTGPVPITSGTAPFTGTYQPEEPLFNFTGVPSGGTWKLRIYDDAGADTGTIGCVNLSILRQP
jgi:subtilisin-like proprotein convertase family protein